MPWVEWWLGLLSRKLSTNELTNALLCRKLIPLGRSLLIVVVTSTFQDEEQALSERKRARAQALSGRGHTPTDRAPSGALLLLDGLKNLY